MSDRQGETNPKGGPLPGPGRRWTVMGTNEDAFPEASPALRRARHWRRSPVGPRFLIAGGVFVLLQGWQSLRHLLRRHPGCAMEHTYFRKSSGLKTQVQPAIDAEYRSRAT